MRTPLATLAVMALCLVAAPTVSADTMLQNVNLSCNDGTNLNLALETASLVELANAVSAINLYPAGDPPLACSLSRSASARSSTSANSSSANGNGPKDFAVGGGQYMTACGLTNFSFSAHAPNGVTAPGTASGTLNASNGATSLCGQFNATSKVDCLQVSGNTADFTALIKHATGFVSGDVGRELAVEAIDNTPDELTDDGGILTTAPCVFDPGFPTPITHGNISVHDAP
jgi:hypothetical protein